MVPGFADVACTNSFIHPLAPLPAPPLPVLRAYPLQTGGSGGGGGGWRCRGGRLASPSRSRGWRRHILIPCLTGALGLRGGSGRDVNMWRRRGV